MKSFSYRSQSSHLKILMATSFTTCALFITSCHDSDGKNSEYDTVAAADLEIIQVVHTTGTLKAVVSVDVGSQVSGKIAALHADFNSVVHKGQLLAEIDSTVYRAELAQTQGQLESAMAEITLKEKNLERKKTLFPLKASSQFDLDQAIAELAESHATVTIDKAQVESAKANLEYCEITSPIDGIVISRKVNEGQTLIAAMNTPVLFTIAQDIRQMDISADISEGDIGQIYQDQPVTFTVESFPGDEFIGKVKQVRCSPTTTQNVVTYETIISVENPQKRLFPGMTTDVSIAVAHRQHAIAVPNAALRFSPPDGAIINNLPRESGNRPQQIIYTYNGRGKELNAVPITEGISDGVHTEIVNGLNLGNNVVVSTHSKNLGGPAYMEPSP